MMPIRPENRRRYPADWPAISRRIRSRASWRCECRGECGWTGCGTNAGPHRTVCNAHDRHPHPATGSTVILTVAHLDHTPENCHPANLRAMCQGCHLAYDRRHHAETARATRDAARRAAGQGGLF